MRRFVPVLYIVALSGLLYVYATVLSGCGGGNVQVGAETARAAACEASEQVIEDQLDAEEITQEQAIERIDCVRLVCDAMHERLVEE